MLRIAIVGAGWWTSRHHLPTLLRDPRVSVVAVVDPDPQRRAALGLAAVQGFDTVEEMLAVAGVEAAVVGTPNATHAVVAEPLLRAGVHVLVEKPLATTSKDAFAMIAAARESGAALRVGFTYHHTSAARMVRQVLSRGDFGRLVHVSIVFDSATAALFGGDPGLYSDDRYDGILPLASTYADPAQAGGGQGHTQVTHPLGLLTWCASWRLRSATARMHVLDGHRVEVAVAAALEGEDASTVAISSCGLVEPGQVAQQRLTYHLERGSLVHDLVTGTVSRWERGATRPTLFGPGAEGPYPTTAPVTAFIDGLADGIWGPEGDADAAAETALSLDALSRAAASGGGCTRVELLAETKVNERTGNE